MHIGRMNARHTLCDQIHQVCVASFVLTVDEKRRVLFTQQSSRFAFVEPAR